MCRPSEIQTGIRIEPRVERQRRRRLASEVQHPDIPSRRCRLGAPAASRRVTGAGCMYARDPGDPSPALHVPDGRPTRASDRGRNRIRQARTPTFHYERCRTRPCRSRSVATCDDTGVDVPTTSRRPTSKATAISVPAAAYTRCPLGVYCAWLPPARIFVAPLRKSSTATCEASVPPVVEVIVKSTAWLPGQVLRPEVIAFSTFAVGCRQDHGCATCGRHPLETGRGIGGGKDDVVVVTPGGTPAWSCRGNKA